MNLHLEALNVKPSYNTEWQTWHLNTCKLWLDNLQTHCQVVLFLKQSVLKYTVSNKIQNIKNKEKYMNKKIIFSTFWVSWSMLSLVLSLLRIKSSILCKWIMLRLDVLFFTHISTLCSVTVFRRHRVYRTSPRDVSQPQSSVAQYTHTHTHTQTHRHTHRYWISVTCEHPESSWAALETPIESSQTQKGSIEQRQPRKVKCKSDLDQEALTNNSLFIWTPSQS